MTVAQVFLKDGRLRPALRVLVYGAAFVVLTGAFWSGLAPLFRASMLDVAAYRSLMAGELASALAAVLAAVVLRKYLDGRPVASLGITPTGGWACCLAIGILLGAGMQATVLALEIAAGSARITGVAPWSSDAAELVHYIPLFALVAITEETLLRGYVLRNLWEEFGLAPAVVITAAIFAALHLGNPNSHENLWFTVAGLAAYGVWAAMSVAWTGSLWLALGVHFAWNLFEGPVFGFPVSGLGTGRPMIAQTFSGPAWLTGGAFGPESGASALIAMALGFVILYLLFRTGFFARAASAR